MRFGNTCPMKLWYNNQVEAAIHINQYQSFMKERNTLK